MSIAKQISPVTDLTSDVRDVFSQVMRYPLEILDPMASLEEDLGIDTGNLDEVFSVLRENYDLPKAEEMDIPREKLTTISGISEALYEFLSGRQTPTETPQEPSPDQPSVDEQQSPQQTIRSLAEGGPSRGLRSESIDLDTISTNIRDVFAQVTRYPLEILDPKASLEEDLGIDSVKLGEVFSVLRENYDLPKAEEMDIPREKLTTISGISEALYEFLSGRQTPTETPQEPTPEEPSVAAVSVAVPIRTQEESFAQNVAEKSRSVLDPERKPFTGKLALITGSGRGIGKDIASYLAELGATVIVNSFHSRNHGIETADQINAGGGNAVHIWGSVANPQQLSSMFDEIEERYGYLDFFVSCASNGILAKLEDTTVEHWEKAFRTNIVGLHQVALKAAKLMRKRGGGKIIALSSPAAYGYVEYFGCMGAVKAGVDSLIKSMAIEFGPDNIQVNSVSPGPVYGELLSKWPDSDRLIARWESATSYKRLCKPRDVSHFVAYLLSEPVKLFTGSVLVMDGGISARSF